jgi:hypothetical protein
MHCSPFFNDYLLLNCLQFNTCFVFIFYHKCMYNYQLYICSTAMLGNHHDTSNKIKIHKDKNVKDEQTDQSESQII